MTSVQLQQWIQHPEQLNRDTLYELRTLVARYPYFQSLHLLYLKNLYLLHDASFGAELRRSVIYVADRRLLFSLIESDSYALRPHKVATVPLQDRTEEPGVDRTLFLIDAFLASMPEEQTRTVPVDVSVDYAAYLLKDESQETSDVDVRLRGQDLIDGFLNQAEYEKPVASVKETVAVAEETTMGAEPAADSIVRNEEISEVVTEPDTVEVEESEDDDELEETAVTDEMTDNCFTETLAKIYIKQHRYEKALEIIKKLSLNYPKKNAYFADQIRFLEKLIINANSK